MPDNLQPRPSVMHLRLECKNAKGFDTPLFEHKTIPEDDATSYDNEERTTRDTLLPTSTSHDTRQKYSTRQTGYMRGAAMA